MSPTPSDSGRVPRKRRGAYLAFGLKTLRAAMMGGRPGGFFIPYRHADAALRAAPPVYPEVEALFDLHRADILDGLAAIDAVGADLRTWRDTDPPPAPRWGQLWFPRLDAAAAYALARRDPPARIVEVGAGHSTRVLARAVRDAGATCDHIVIDPRPRADLSGLPVRWEKRVLDVRHLALFDALESADIAFFDPSHILMPGTDLDLIVSRVLPRLRVGVRVHLHDIFLPDAYPPDWAWRGYNEQNAVAALLLGSSVTIDFASRYALTRLNATAVSPTLAALPIGREGIESSLWLRKRDGAPVLR